jgi:hypothetical protein
MNIKREVVISSDDSEEMMKAMGLPTGFSCNWVQQGSEDTKKKMYCDVCELELNSLDTMASHLQGQKHMVSATSIV